MAKYLKGNGKLLEDISYTHIYNHPSPVMLNGLERQGEQSEGACRDSEPGGGSGRLALGGGRAVERRQVQRDVGDGIKRAS